MIISILSWIIKLHKYSYYEKLLALTSGAWLSFPNYFFYYFYLVIRAFLFFIYNFMNNWITSLPLSFKFFSIGLKGLVVIS